MKSRNGKYRLPTGSSPLINCQYGELWQLPDGRIVQINHEDTYRARDGCYVKLLLLTRNWKDLPRKRVVEKIVIVDPHDLVKL